MNFDISAHGAGGQQDLPIPLNLAASGGVAALVLSFAILAWAWRKPRYQDETALRSWAAPRWIRDLVDSPAWLATWRIFGVVVTAYAALAAIAGPNSAINPVVGIFYIYLWVGIVALSFLFGPVYRTISPARSLVWLLSKIGGAPPGIKAYPQWLGYWPAALGLFAFAWIELVKPVPTDLGGIRFWCAIYLGVMMMGSAVFGERFLERADPFEVLSTLVGGLSVWGREDGRLVLRSPLANVNRAQVDAGLTAVVGVLLGSTAYDGFRESPHFVKFVQDSSIDGRLLRNLGLLAFCLAAIGIFTLGATLTGVGPTIRRRDLPNLLAPSVIPIIFGYFVAHYLTLLVESGQRYLAYLGDPFGRGDDWFGLAGVDTNYWLSNHPGLLATIKVLAVVTGHVTAAVVAHDRAVAVLPKRHQITGQLSMLAVMIIFTGGGLLLLFSA